MKTWFANPEALWLLALLPALGLLALLAWHRRRQALAQLGNGLAFSRLARVRRGRRRLRALCLAVGLTALVTGIAGPQWGRDGTLTAPGRDVVVVLDLSRSMLAEQPSRQERALKALRDLCDTVQQRGGHRLALVVFAAHARVVCPLTHDYDHVRNALDELDAATLPPDLRPEPDGPSGTRMGEALRLAAATHDPRFQGGQDILMISDGDDPAADGDWAEGAELARQQNVPIHTVGVGDPDTASTIPLGADFLRHEGEVVKTRLQEGPLQEIARRTSGLYLPARTGALPLGQLFREVIEPRRRVRAEADDAVPTPRQRYAWFFGVALLLLAATLLIGDGRNRRG